MLAAGRKIFAFEASLSSLKVPSITHTIISAHIISNPRDSPDHVLLALSQHTVLVDGMDADVTHRHRAEWVTWKQVSGGSR